VLFVFAFGIGPMAGVLAIGLHTMGALGKLYAEVAEAADPEPVRGVRATGASWAQVMRYGALPQVAPAFESHGLLRFEINVRAASVLGFVGAGGIGQDLYTAIKSFAYTDISAIALMLIATVGQEYAWYPNNLDDLPSDAVVLSEREQQAAWQPWTYVRPWVRGFIAYSPGDMVETAEGSDMFVIQVHLRERWQPGIIRPVLVDCTGLRRGDVTGDMVFDATGQPEGVIWIGEGPEDPVVRTVCGHDAPAS